MGKGQRWSVEKVCCKYIKRKRGGGYLGIGTLTITNLGFIQQKSALKVKIIYYIGLYFLQEISVKIYP